MVWLLQGPLIEAGNARPRMEAHTMRRKFLPFVLAGALAAAVAAPAAASHTAQHQVAGAAGLVAAVIQAQVRDVNVVVLNNSLNNLLRNADIDVLNDSEILSRFNIVIQDIDIVDESTIIVSVLSGGIAVGPITLQAPGA